MKSLCGCYELVNEKCLEIPMVNAQLFSVEMPASQKTGVNSPCLSINSRQATSQESLNSILRVYIFHLY